MAEQLQLSDFYSVRISEVKALLKRMGGGTPKTLAGVYAIINIKTGTRYVGSSVNLPKRLKQNTDALRGKRHGNKRLQVEWECYGGRSFVCEVLERVEAEPYGRTHSLENCEQSYINVYSPNVYNINPASVAYYSSNWRGVVSIPPMPAISSQPAQIESSAPVLGANFDSHEEPESPLVVLVKQLQPLVENLMEHMDESAAPQKEPDLRSPLSRFICDIEAVARKYKPLVAAERAGR